MTSSNDPKPVVYIVDDDHSVRAALQDLFASVTLDAMAFSSIREFLEHPRTAGPACLVLDVRMPAQSGMDFYLQMDSLGLRMPVIFITGHGDIAMGVRAIKDGAVDFLTKPFRDHDLLDAVHTAIARDQQRLHQEEILSELQRRWESLNTGERDVLRLVVRGLLNKQIAAELSVKEITVKVRRARVMQKMRAASFADLVRMADQLELGAETRRNS
ncbi:nodulation protein W, DNA-binding response regulator [Azorhizobium caulinodans ORS 571]|uniref:Nodulation protein W, DNA-binding response regulator n=1 Tax=Azorhizobium caulinodans (strain ATCC 43989 / DSM 5975 / JCM 20966 / LMG 6465 / NBRC 14845 / NCIMB 13405 / ORS 571) TaxID=438753 RepID=A8IHA1_AZOC5|nr:response regulator [Azorhizobium caulinodans]BAF86192.1 nodulation protein W, DNA-binding response regulator [Azorhizobium caulinodans ORS 571]